ncbi:NAD(P)/FAD-dependent oxidoreductase [Streptomyces apocyni]|uniref:NAD(P)/FAD-dependent oxidoreductase n=1 Tax=Streptomyces apocyni TaxID=2654677 RepID=UPI0012EAB26D|nr:FAD-dependent oxidoreductase [Streptomyces apocyni]
MTNSTAKNDHQVLVLGAGYAGLLAALSLAPHARVTLVDPSEHFTERVRQHELAAGRPAITHPLRSFLGTTGVEHIAARATAIDLHARVVTTDNGRSLPYDRLVYALGSRTADTADTGGERAFTAETADALRKRLRDRPGRLAIVGGGLTGIEMAAELAEAYPDWDVRLLSREVGAGLSAKGRAHVRTTLTALGVSLAEGERVTSADDVDADAVLWSASMVPNTELAARSGLALHPSNGRVEVDAFLRSASHPEVYVAGDAAAASAPGAGPLRMACATALPTGTQAAAALRASLDGTEPRPFRFGYQLQCVSLGRRNGLVQTVHSDDTPRELILRGRVAAFTKEQIVRYTVRLIRQAAR